MKKIKDKRKEEEFNELLFIPHPLTFNSICQVKY